MRRMLVAFVGALVLVFVLVLVVVLAGRSHGHGGKAHRTGAPIAAG